MNGKSKLFKYTVPAAIFGLLLSGCNMDFDADDSDSSNTDNSDTTESTDAGSTETGSGSGSVDEGSETEEPTPPPANTVLGEPAFKSPVTVPGLPGYTGLDTFSSYLFKPALADMDGDGDLDMVVGEKYETVKFGYMGYFNQKVIYYKNISDGSPAFEEADTELANLPFKETDTADEVIGPVFPALFDFDEDDDTDLFYSQNKYKSFNHSCEINRRNNVDNDFSDPSAPNSVASISDGAAAITLADIDGDGDPDMIIGKTAIVNDSTKESEKSIVYKENTGSAEPFKDMADTELVSASGVSKPENFPVPALADIDGDGDMDMLAVDFKSGDISFYRNTGTAASPEFTEETPDFTLLPDDGTRYFPAFADVDGDGDMDIIAGTDDGRILFIENTDIDS